MASTNPYSSKFLLTLLFLYGKIPFFLWKIPVPLVEKPSITICACAKIGVRAELHVDQLLFASLCFF